MREIMKIKENMSIVLIMILVLVICSCTGKSNNETVEQDNQFYQQCLLYIQQGLRDYQVEGTYKVYFREQEEEQLQEMILAGESGDWYEQLYYSYDEERDWYTFFGNYEPILTKDEFYAESDYSTLKDEIIPASVYTAEVSADIRLNDSIRFDSPDKPVVSEHIIEEGHWRDYSSDIRQYQYMMMDKRKESQVCIFFPQFSLYSSSANEAEKLNQFIREYFFYGYNHDDFEPLQLLNTWIDRTYRITRQDEEYLSMRIYEYNYACHANHPNEWETGLTIDLATNEIMTLEAVLERYLGKSVTLEELLGAGAFRGLWVWRDSANQDEEELNQQWLEQIINQDGGREMSYFDKYFYLTEDGIGLITSISRYYTCVEASFEDLKEALW